MKKIRKHIQILMTLLGLGAGSIHAQILVPDDLPISGDIVFMKSKANKLWVIQSLPNEGKIMPYSVTAKSGGKWERYPTLFLNMQNNSKAVKITDLEMHNGRVYVSGDFAIHNKSANCLAFLEPQASAWSGSILFTSNQVSPVVNALAVQNNILYAGGIFIKANSVECANLVRIDKSFGIGAMKYYGNIGTNGPVTGIETDSLETTIFIGGHFRNIFGKGLGGLVQFKPSDSVIKSFGSNQFAVHKMAMAGSKLMLYAQKDTGNAKRLYTLSSGSLNDASGIDSIYEISSLFYHRGRMLFTGSARLSSNTREAGIYEFFVKNAATRVYSKFSKIWLGESFGEFIYVTGSFANSIFNENEPFNFAYIHEDFQRFYGRVFHDANGNGVFNAGIDTRVGGKDVRVSPYNLLIPVDKSGYFSFIIPRGKSQLIQVIIEKTSELLSGAQFKFNADTFTERIVEFPIKFIKNSYSNVKVNVSAAAGWKCRKDTSELYAIRVSNTGLTTVNPDIKLNFSGKLVLIKPVPAPDIIDPGKLTWSKQTLKPGDERIYLVKLTTPSSDFSDNDQVSFSAVVANAPDDNPADNSDTLSQTVSSGVQPNAKFQFPEAAPGDTFAWLLPGAGKVDYIIRFSNNTNDTLNTVVVRDTISTPYFVTYIQETGSSHPFTRYVYTTPALPEKVIVSYTFNNIKLPPNPSGNTEIVNSSGYVGFRLGLANNLASGIDLRNRASIYMDNYSPILTNTVVAVVAGTKTLWNDVKNDQILYPNPVSEQIFFHGNVEGGEFKLYNAQGQIINQTIVQFGTVSFTNKNIGSGTYFWTLNTDNGKVSKGVLIKN